MNHNHISGFHGDVISLAIVVVYLYRLTMLQYHVQ